MRRTLESDQIDRIRLIHYLRAAGFDRPVLRFRAVTPTLLEVTLMGGDLLEIEFCDQPDPAAVGDEPPTILPSGGASRSSTSRSRKRTKRGDNRLDTDPLTPENLAPEVNALKRRHLPGEPRSTELLHDPDGFTGPAAPWRQI